MSLRLATRTLNCAQSRTRENGGSKLLNMTGTHPAKIASFKRGVHGANPPMIGQYFAVAMAALKAGGAMEVMTMMSGFFVLLPQTSWSLFLPSRKPGSAALEAASLKRPFPAKNANKLRGGEITKGGGGWTKFGVGIDMSLKL